MALGSDAMVTALEGYALLKVLGKGSGLDALRRDMSVRFTRKARATEKPGASCLKPGPQSTKAPFAGFFSWGSGWAGLARKAFLLAAKAQSSALGPQMGKVQGSSALRLGFTILKRKAFGLAARVQMPALPPTGTAIAEFQHRQPTGGQHVHRKHRTHRREQ